MANHIRGVAKGRSQRIQIDYFRHPSKLTQSRGLLALLALLFAGGYCIYVLAAGSASHLTTGPLAQAHTAFENSCEKCHTDFTPISSDSLLLDSSSALAVQEAACQSCHRADAHFRNELTLTSQKTDQHCSGCHLDHQGRDFDMVKLSSDACVQCHGNLTKHCQAKPVVKHDITAFTLESHGPFVSLSQGDQGRIKFDHAQHMLPGQVDADSKGSFTLAMLEPDQRERYRQKVNGQWQADDAVVTLQCNSCHEPAGRPSEQAVGDTEVGRHIKPIRFDDHCQACHAINAPGRDDQTLPLPHAAPWAELNVIMSAKLAGSQWLGRFRSPTDAVRKEPLVGEGDDGALVLQGSDATLSKPSLVDSQRDRVKEACLKCHVESDLTDEAITKLRSNAVPPLISERWLRRGIFDHAAHGKMACSYCHEVPTSDPTHAGQPAKDQTVVMINSIATCMECHRDSASPEPASLQTDKAKQLLNGQTTWASDRCTECHRYHWSRPEGDSSKPIVMDSISVLKASLALGANDHLGKSEAVK